MREGIVVTGTIVTLRRRTWRTTGPGWGHRSRARASNSTERESGSVHAARTWTSTIVRYATGSLTETCATSRGQTLTSGEWSPWGTTSSGGRETGTAGGKEVRMSDVSSLSLSLSGVETSTLRSERLATSVRNQGRMLRMRAWGKIFLKSRWKSIKEFSLKGRHQVVVLNRSGWCLSVVIVFPDNLNFSALVQVGYIVAWWWGVAINLEVVTVRIWCNSDFCVWFNKKINKFSLEWSNCFFHCVLTLFSACTSHFWTIEINH